MNKLHVRKDDEVVVISGDSKGVRGKVIAASPEEGKVIVAGANIVSKHQKPRKQGENGGILKVEAAMYASKVQIVCPNSKCEKHNKGIYKEYKIATNNYGYTVKGYHVLEISKAGETYGLYFPAYERHIVEKITNLTAEEAAE